MIFEEAFKILREGGEASRKDWRCCLHAFAGTGDHGVILREWPSGVTSLYEPILEDLVAEDWEAVPFPERLGKGTVIPPSSPVHKRD